MRKIIILILVLLPNVSFADQGLKISCFDMKSLIIGRKHDPLKFTLQAVGLQYFDKEKNKFVNNELLAAKGISADEVRHPNAHARIESYVAPEITAEHH